MINDIPIISPKMVGKYHHVILQGVLFSPHCPAEVTQLSFLLHVFHHVDDLLHWSDIWPRCADLFSTHNVDHLESWKPQDSTFSIFFNIPWLPVSSLLMGSLWMGIFQVLSSKGLTTLGLSWLHKHGCQMTPTPVARQRRKGGGTALQEMAGIGLMSVPRCCSSQAERGKLRNSHQFMWVSCTCSMCEEQKFGRHEIASFRVNQKPCRIQSTCQLVLKITYVSLFFSAFIHSSNSGASEKNRTFSSGNEIPRVQQCNLTG